MFTKANQCPKCKQFIFGTYCCNCKKDINEMAFEDFKDILGENLFNQFFNQN